MYKATDLSCLYFNQLVLFLLYLETNLITTTITLIISRIKINLFAKSKYKIKKKPTLKKFNKAENCFCISE